MAHVHLLRDIGRREVDEHLLLLAARWPDSVREDRLHALEQEILHERDVDEASRCHRGGPDDVVRRQRRDDGVTDGERRRGAALGALEPFVDRHRRIALKVAELGVVAARDRGGAKLDALVAFDGAQRWERRADRCGEQVLHRLEQRAAVELDGFRLETVECCARLLH